MSPSVRVVVVTYSPGETLECFVHSLRAATTRELEVVLADNGSTDGAPEAMAATGAARLVRTGGNLGYGGGANVGARGATAEWLVVANPDIEWTPGSLDRLLEAGERWPRAGALGPAILTAEGELYPSARALPSLGRGTGHAVFGWIWPSNPWTVAYRRERGAPAEGPTGWLSGSCLLLRRAPFEAVGGFDEAYFMFFEDTDLCERLGLAGWSSVHVPSAVVHHIGGHSWRATPEPMLRAHHASAYRYLSRRYAGPRHLPLRAGLRLGLGVRYLLSRRIGRLAEGAQPTRHGTALGERDGEG